MNINKIKAEPVDSVVDHLNNLSVLDDSNDIEHDDSNALSDGYIVEEPQTPENKYHPSEKAFNIHEMDVETYLSVDSGDYWNIFHPAPISISHEEAYGVLLKYKSYSPFLEDIVNCQVPKTYPIHCEQGFSAVAKRNDDTLNLLCKGMWKKKLIPGTDILVCMHLATVGKFIMSVFVIDNMDHLLIHYGKNQHKLTFVDNVPSLTTHGGMSPHQAFVHMISSVDDVLEEMPELEHTKYTNFCFVVKSDFQKDHTLLATEDGFNWVQKGKDLKRFNPKWEVLYLLSGDVHKEIYRPFKSESDLSDDQKEGAIVFRMQRATHPTEQMYRYIYCFTLLSNTRHIISHGIIYQYIIKGNPSPDILRRNPDHRKSPRVMEIIRQAMQFRTVDHTKLFLKQESNLEVTSRVIQNAARRNKVPTFIRRQVGDKEEVDLVQLVKSTLLINGGYTVVSNMDYPTGFHVQLFTDQFRCVLASLPTASELAAHRRKCELLDHFSNRKERLDYFNREFIPMQNDSGLLKKLAGVLMVDVTFGIAPTYCTIVYASVASFETKTVNKTRYLPIAFIYHPKKVMDLHVAVVSALDKMFLMFKEYRNKRFPCLLTDGEDALKVYKQSLVCEDAVYLRCAVHMKGNMTGQNRSIITSQIFGTLSETDEPLPAFLSSVEENPICHPRNKRVMKNYLLGALTVEEYDQFVDQLMESPTTVERVKNYVSNNRISLYEFYSLRRRVEACYIAQFVTTNPLESFNGKIKRWFDGKQAIHTSLTKLINRTNDQLKELMKAVMGTSSEIVCTRNCDWNRLNDAEKCKLLRTLGLSYMDSGDWEGLSVDFVRAVSVERLRHTELLFSEYTVSDVDQKTVLLMYRNNHVVKTFTLHVERSANSIKTKCHNNCKAPLLCDHQLIFLMSLNELDRHNFVRGHYDVESHRRVLAANTKTAGHKRKGREFSKGNHSRKIDAMEDGSLITRADNADSSSDLIPQEDVENGSWDMRFDEFAHDGNSPPLNESAISVAVSSLVERPLIGGAAPSADMLLDDIVDEDDESYMDEPHEMTGQSVEIIVPNSIVLPQKKTKAKNPFKQPSVRNPSVGKRKARKGRTKEVRFSSNVSEVSERTSGLLADLNRSVVAQFKNQLNMEIVRTNGGGRKTNIPNIKAEVEEVRAAKQRGRPPKKCGVRADVKTVTAAKPRGKQAENCGVSGKIQAVKTGASTRRGSKEQKEANLSNKKVEKHNVAPRPMRACKRTSSEAQENTVTSKRRSL